ITSRAFVQFAVFSSNSFRTSGSSAFSAGFPASTASNGEAGVSVGFTSVGGGVSLAGSFGDSFGGSDVGSVFGGASTVSTADNACLYLSPTLTFNGSDGGVTVFVSTPDGAGITAVSGISLSLGLFSELIH